MIKEIKTTDLPDSVSYVCFDYNKIKNGYRLTTVYHKNDSADAYSYAKSMESCKPPYIAIELAKEKVISKKDLPEIFNFYNRIRMFKTFYEDYKSAHLIHNRSWSLNQRLEYLVYNARTHTVNDCIYVLEFYDNTIQLNDCDGKLISEKPRVYKDIPDDASNLIETLLSFK